MSESEFNKFRELSWRRPLDAIEEARLQAYLASHPDQQAAWEEEAALTHTLNQLPSAPISSNFTALVLQSLDKPTPARLGLEDAWRGWLRRRFRSLAWGTGFALVLAAVCTGYEMRAQRQLRQGAGLIVAAIPEPDAFANFETIQKLGPLHSMDEELWVALNK